MDLLRVGLVSLLAVTSLAACGKDEPPRASALTSFEVNTRGDRVFAKFGQSGNLTEELTLPDRARAVGFNLDCVGSKGTLKVALSGIGGASLECPVQNAGKGAHAFLSGDGSKLDPAQTMTIEAEAGIKWSVAIDAGAKLTSN